MAFFALLHARKLSWDFTTYCSIAHFDGESLRGSIYKNYPSLEGVEWDQLYQEKKSRYEALIEKGVGLMPGVASLLGSLRDKKIPSCVVTNSPKVQVECIRQWLPELDLIDDWITRECYDQPKPSPDGYATAIKRHGAKRAVGFEDTAKGLKSLLQTDAQAVLVAKPEAHPPSLKEWLAKTSDRSVWCYPSLEAVSV